MKLSAFFKFWVQTLESKSVADSFRSVEVICMHVLNLSREKLFLSQDESLSIEQQMKIETLLEQRLLHTPVAYLIEKREFRGLDFYVSSDVLIPRPETEQMIDLAIQELKLRPMPQTLVDVGTGSGVIAICMKKEYPSLRCIGFDLSRESLSVAERNANTHKVSIEWQQSNLLSALEAPVDLILANLPYISEEEYLALDATVKDFEPKRALVSGSSGLELTLQLMDESMGKLKKDGVLICEVGASQTEKLCLEAKHRGFSFVRVYNDLANLPRMIALSWSKPYGLR